MDVAAATAAWSAAATCPPVAALWRLVAAAIANLTLRRPVYARASMAPLAPPSQKSKSPSRKLPRNLIAWYVPEGYAVASQPPTSAQLEFGCEAGDALLGKHILFHWEGMGWCEGILESRNMDSSLMIDEETRGIVNFIVHYAIDDEKSQHNLELQFYGGGPAAAFGYWVLLEPAPSASGARAEGTAVPALADGAPTSTATPRSLPPHGFTDDGMAAKSDQPKRLVWRPQWKPPNGAVAKRRTGRLENALAENARARP
jgi:hypothetical protein